MGVRKKYLNLDRMKTKMIKKKTSNETKAKGAIYFLFLAVALK